MLFELLKQRHPGLRQEGLESLIDLVGGKRGGRREPPLSIIQSFDEGVRELRKEGVVSAEPLDAVTVAASEILREGFSPEAPGDLPLQDVLRNLERRGILLKKGELPKSQTFRGVRAHLTRTRDPVHPERFATGPLAGPIRRVLTSPVTRQIACTLGGPILARGLFSANPLITVGAAAGLTLCGISIVEAAGNA